MFLLSQAYKYWLWTFSWTYFFLSFQRFQSTYMYRVELQVQASIFLLQIWILFKKIRELYSKFESYPVFWWYFDISWWKTHPAYICSTLISSLIRISYSMKCKKKKKSDIEAGECIAEGKVSVRERWVSYFLLKRKRGSVCSNLRKQGGPWLRVD